MRRFCSKCGKLEPVACFEGARKTCAVKLIQHNDVRRERYHAGQPHRKRGGRAGAPSPSPTVLPPELTALVRLWVEADVNSGLTHSADDELSGDDDGPASLFCLATELCLSWDCSVGASSLWLHQGAQHTDAGDST